MLSRFVFCSNNNNNNGAADRANEHPRAGRGEESSAHRRSSGSRGGNMLKGFIIQLISIKSEFH